MLADRRRSSSCVGQSLFKQHFVDAAIFICEVRMSVRMSRDIAHALEYLE